MYDFNRLIATNLPSITKLAATMAITARHTSNDGRDIEARPSVEPLNPRYQSNNPPFAGRLGANQACVVDGTTLEDQKILEHQPDATSHMSFSELIDMRPIANINLWKAALIEGVGNTDLRLSFKHLTDCLQAH